MNMVKSAVAIFLFGIMSVTYVNAAQYNVTSDQDNMTIIGTQGAGYDLDGIAHAAVNADTLSKQNLDTNNIQQGVIMQNKADITGLNGKIDGVNSSLSQSIVDESTARGSADAALGAQIQSNSNAISTIQKQAASGAFNGKDGADGAKGDKGDTGATGLQGVAGVNGKDGKDGANGKDGVTTTVTKLQVDTATKAKVDTNAAAITSTATQSARVAQDLKDAKSFFSQQQASNNAKFQSLQDEMDGNKKEARSGAASAIAIASMPQVERGQNIMFSAGVGSFKNEQALSIGASFHAGAATVKTGVSSSTNNDFAMGAGIGIGF